MKPVLPGDYVVSSGKIMWLAHLHSGPGLPPLLWVGDEPALVVSSDGSYNVTLFFRDRLWLCNLRCLRHA